jgi:hypothetical protein
MAKIIKMNNIYNNFNKNIVRKLQTMDNEDTILGVIDKLHRESERRVPEYGDFGLVRTHFKNKDKDSNAKFVELLIKPSILLKERPKERELEVVIKSAGEKQKYSLVLKRGDKKEILDYLHNEELPLKIQDAIEDASSSFSEL